MTTKTFIPLQSSEVPVSFTVTIDDRDYDWTIRLNEDNDFYSVLIKDEDGTLLYTSKIILDNDILHAGIALQLTSEVVPRDLVAGDQLRVGDGDLGNPVKLYVE